MDSERYAVCNNFERKRMTDCLGVYQHRFAFDCTPGELLRSTSRCQYCHGIFDGIREFREDIGDFVNNVSRIYVRGPAEDGPYTLSLEIYFRESRPKLGLEFLTHNKTGTSTARGTIRHTEQMFKPKDPMCAQTLLWVQSHIENCFDNHIRCPKSDHNPLPIRVLSILRSAEGALQVKLKETEGLSGRYVCLSHRWGGSDTATTCQNNYSQMLESIEWTDIPKTFQDAIRYVDALDISYLWIDSYCIIQDSSADWSTESKKMASIYKNSYLTIAATAAPSNQAGCFWNQNGFHGRYIRVGSPSLKEFEHVSIRNRVDHWERIWTSNRESQFPLLTRAWFFQERILAPRILHFSHHELVWECTERGDCQCGAYDNRSNAKSISWRMNNSWRKAVELYTSLKLSRPSDRLAALHGFAEFYGRTVASNIDRDYRNGLRKDSLHLDLLWRINTLANVDMNVRHLCRCWDTKVYIPNFASVTPKLTFERQTQRSCQYSHSAACSVKCLQLRRLCRYGDISAAIGCRTRIEGLSCIDWKQEKTDIPQLLQYEKQNPRLYQNNRSTFPTWTWASADHNVDYRSDNVYSSQSDRKKTACLFHTGNVSHRKDANIGEASKHVQSPRQTLSLKAEGFLVPAELLYRDISIPKPLVDQHNPTKGRSDVEWSHDILKYGVRIQHGAQDLDFYPDWALSLDGPNFIPNHTHLYLFHITGNAYLVLKEKWFFDVECHLRTGLTQLVKDDLRHKINTQEERVSMRKHNLASPSREGRSEPRGTSHTQQDPQQDNTPLELLHDGKDSGTRQTSSYSAEQGGCHIPKDKEMHFGVRENPDTDLRQPLSNDYVSFVRVGVLRTSWRLQDSLHNESHWIDKIEIG